METRGDVLFIRAVGLHTHKLEAVQTKSLSQKERKKKRNEESKKREKRTVKLSGKG